MGFLHRWKKLFVLETKADVDDLLNEIADDVIVLEGGSFGYGSNKSAGAMETDGVDDNSAPDVNLTAALKPKAKKKKHR